MNSIPDYLKDYVESQRKQYHYQLTVDEYYELDSVINADLYAEYDVNENLIDLVLLDVYNYPELEKAYRDVPAGNYSHDGFITEYKMTHEDTLFW